MVKVTTHEVTYDEGALGSKLGPADDQPPLSPWAT